MLGFLCAFHKNFSARSLWVEIFHLICSSSPIKIISILGISNDCQIVTVVTTIKIPDDRSDLQILRNSSHNG